MSFTPIVSTTVSDETVSSGTQRIINGGMAQNNIIEYGGYQNICSGGAASDTIVNSGGGQNVSSGGRAANTIINEGIQRVNGSAVSAVINLGGRQDVSGAAADTAINFGGSQYVSSGGKVSGTIISYGGNQYVSSGGRASGTIIGSDGNQHISYGGKAVDTIINSGGKQYMADAAVNTVINSGGCQLLQYACGSANATTVNRGGYLYTEWGATQTQVNFGGMLMIGSRGWATGFNIASGGILGWDFGASFKGTSNGRAVSSASTKTSFNLYLIGGVSQSVGYSFSASSTTINSGGYQFINVGGRAANTIINSGGSQTVFFGGAANNNIINRGLQSVNGTVTNTTVNSGGSQRISVGGMTNGTTVNFGGSQYVEGGRLLGALTIAGGDVVLANASAIASLAKISYKLANAQTNDILLKVNDGVMGLGATSYSLDLSNTGFGSYILADGANLIPMGGKRFSVSYNNKYTNLQVGSNYTFTDGARLELNFTNGANDRLTAVFTAAATDRAANDYRTAKDIANLDNWVGGGDPADCYSLTMNSAGILTLNLTGLTGDANLSLLDANGKLLKSSARKGNANEAISADLLGGTYYVKVAPYNGVNSAAYTLTHAEQYSPADTVGNSFETAFKITSNGPVHEWLGVGDKDDCYKFELQADSTVTLDLHGLSSNVNLYLYDSNGKQLALSAKAGNADESISKALKSGIYFAKATLAGKDNTAYNLDFVASPAAFKAGSLKMFSASSPLTSGADTGLSNDPLKKNQGMLAS